MSPSAEVGNSWLMFSSPSLLLPPAHDMLSPCAGVGVASDATQFDQSVQRVRALLLSAEVRALRGLGDFLEVAVSALEFALFDFDFRAALGAVLAGGGEDGEAGLAGSGSGFLRGLPRFLFGGSIKAPVSLVGGETVS